MPCRLNIGLPEQEERAPKRVESDLLKTVQSVYGSIDLDLAQLPDCFVAAPEFGALMQARSAGKILGSDGRRF